jgi:hypothetical protein
VGNPLTLSSTRSLAMNSQLGRIVHEAVRQQSETGTMLVFFLILKIKLKSLLLIIQ